MKSELKYGYETILEIENETQLVEKLRNLILEDNIPNKAYHLTHTSGNELVIGLSSTLCSVQFTDTQLAVYIPVPTSKDKDVIEFLLGGHHSEIPKNRCVSLDQAINVAQTFFNTGELPDKAIKWEVFHGF